MKKERVFSRAVLLSAVFALSQFAGWANAQELQKAPGVGLKSVPIRSLFGLRKPVKQVQFQEDQSRDSSVTEELQKIQQQKEKDAEEPRNIFGETKSGRERRLKERRGWRAQKPAGLLQRLFGGEEKKVKQPQPATQRPAPIPRPPALNYRTADGNLAGSGVPARLASQSRVVTSQAGVGKAEAHSSNFVSPFEPEQKSQADVLLDLDSLITREKKTAGADATSVDLSAGDSEDLPGVTVVEEDAAEVASVEISTEPQNADSVIPQAKGEIEGEETVLAAAAEPIVIEKQEPLKQDIPLLPPTDTTQPAAADSVPVDVTTTDEAPVAEAATTPKVEKPLTPAQKRARQRQQILERSGQKGFKGFCPVELRNNRELVDSSEKIAARYGLNTYYLSSAEAKAEFEANPGRFAPAAGGADVVVLANTAESVEGSLDFCLWYRDRLYLFTSRETQQLFSRSPARFAR